MTEVLMWHSKKPRSCDLRGFSIPFWVGGLIPRSGYQLFFSVQPFADVVGNYTCQNREKNDRSSLMRFTPFLYLSGGGSVVHYITGAEMPQEAISPCLFKIQFEYRYEVQELMKVIDKYVKQNPAEKENKTLERFFDLLDVMDMEW